MRGKNIPAGCLNSDAPVYLDLGLFVAQDKLCFVLGHGVP